MKAERCFCLLLFLFAIVFAFCFADLSVSTGQQDLFFKAGDPSRGRSIFIEMKCNACHQVIHDEQLPPPVLSQAPLLGASGGLMTPEDLLKAITSPYHRIKRDDSNANLFSSVPYYEELSTQSLIDLITYLRLSQERG